MKSLINILTLSLLIFSFSACAQDNNKRFILGKEHAQEQIKKVLSTRVNQQPYDTLIKNKQVAISIAEAIVFDIYGKTQILEERPYECYLIDGFWYIAGTIPEGSKGGGFEIILSAKNAEVIKLTHYK